VTALLPTAKKMRGSNGGGGGVSPRMAEAAHETFGGENTKCGRLGEAREEW
jgi:hypothetical protein